MGQIVLAYHGCDVTVRDGLVRGELTPRISSNAYDWLGDGLYFFEGDHNRALKLAMFAHAQCAAPRCRHAGCARSAAGGCVGERRGANSLTGRSAALCRSTRPRGPVDAGRRSRSGLQTAVELRLGEKRAGQLQDLVGFAQLLVLAFKFLQALQVGRRDAGPGAVVDLIALDPFVEGLRHAADLGGDGFNGGPQRGVLASVLLHHANSAFAYLG